MGGWRNVEIQDLRDQEKNRKRGAIHPPTHPPTHLLTVFIRFFAGHLLEEVVVQAENPGASLYD